MTHRQASGPTGETGPHPGRHAAEIIHSVEGVVEHAVEAAERSLAQRLGDTGMRALLWSARMRLASISLAMTCASVVLPRPGGPCRST